MSVVTADLSAVETDSTIPEPLNVGLHPAYENLLDA